MRVSSMASFEKCSLLVMAALVTPGSRTQPAAGKTTNQMRPTTILPLEVRCSRGPRHRLLRVRFHAAHSLALW